MKKEGTCGPVNKERRTNYETDNNQINTLEIFDIVVNDIPNRFEFSRHFSAPEFIFVNNFNDYSKTFPENYFKITIQCYPSTNSQKLRTEVQVLMVGDGAISPVPNNRMSNFCDCASVLEITESTSMTTWKVNGASLH